MKILFHKDELVVCINCQTQLHNIVRSGFFSDEQITTLHNPARVINVNFPVCMDDKTVRLIPGFRIQYSDAMGPTKGGIRIHPKSNAGEVSELSFLMSLKTALLGLPYGGAKGAIIIDPKKLSLGERERVVRGYTKAIAKFIGPDFDIPAPDVNTGPQEMAWVRDEYEKIVGHSEPAIVTGKSLDNDGILGRDTATAQGGFYVILEHLFKSQNKTPQETTVAVQGFGNVGAHLSELLDKEGFKVTAVSDSGTGLYDPEGLPVGDLLKFKKDRGKFTERPERKVTNEELLELSVDILIPAALGGIITEKNAKKIKTKLIIEMANAPISPEADTILEDKSVTVIPDILSNAGGVVVSYFEWRQNKDGTKLSLEEVNKRLKIYMLKAYKKISSKAVKENINLRSAAFVVAISKILDAEKSVCRK